jgi:2'-5' RNA ligase
MIERFEGFRTVPNLHMTLAEMGCFADAGEERIKKA